jgi:hypothetical protein
MAEKNSQSKNVNNDAGLDIDLTDLEDISLEDLDDFEGIDFDNLELDDIDFDDLDVTNLDTGIAYQKEPLDTDEFDFDFDSLLAEDKKPENVKPAAETKENKKAPQEASGSSDVFSDADAAMKTDTAEPTQEDIDAFLSALNEGDQDDPGINSEDYSNAGSELDDLFKQSMELSMENGELDDIEDRSGETKKKGDKPKKSISEILFGEPDEEDAEEERLLAEKKAEKEIKKAEAAQKKESKKAQKDAKKKEALAVKDKVSKGKAQAKAAKKAAKEAEYLAELEEEKNEKQLSTAAVVVVFALFVFLGGFVILGTKGFDYSQVVRKATEYFERQRYRLAYDEIAGVEVKEKDEDLKDRIYTVMYVERLYESYENNMTLGRTEKALDALLRGLEKYDEHYEEAVELDIAGDIDACKQKIISALAETFSMTEEDAYAVINMDGQQYSAALIRYSEGVPSGKADTSEQSDTSENVTVQQATGE